MSHNFKMLHGERVAMTAEEIAEHATAQAAAQADSEAEAIVVAAEAAKKASGKQKLKDLGLDDEEIKQLTGA